MQKELIRISTEDLEKHSTEAIIYDSLIGSSVISLKTDKETGTPFVLKRIYKERLVSEEMIEDAMRECRISASLSHPNIVSFYGYTVNDDYIDIRMEYMNKHDYLHCKISDVYSKIDECPNQKHGKSQIYCY